MESPAAMSGREMVEAVVAGRLPQPPMLETLAIRLVEVGDGYAVCEAQPGPEHLNPSVVHGGYAMTMLDAAAGAAANTLRPAGGSIGTIETKVNFVKAIPGDAGLIRATGRVLSGGNRIVVSEAQLTDHDGTLLAVATSSLLISRPKA
jgi:uncharacterized protein (TIGR00369 family)